MANALKGEVAFDVGGKTYRLVFSTNALCDLEGALNSVMAEIGPLLASGSLRAIRAALWAGLQTHHKDVTLLQAGDMLQEMTAEKAVDVVSRALTLAFPQAEAKGEENPPKPGQDGTGSASSKTGSASA